MWAGHKTAARRLWLGNRWPDGRATEIRSRLRRTAPSFGALASRATGEREGEMSPALGDPWVHLGVSPQLLIRTGRWACVRRGQMSVGSPFGVRAWVIPRPGGWRGVKMAPAHAVPTRDTRLAPARRSQPGKSFRFEVWAPMFMRATPARLQTSVHDSASIFSHRRSPPIHQPEAPVRRRDARGLAACFCPQSLALR